jgi:hypothetical protein
MDVDDFFRGYEQSRPLFDALRHTIADLPSVYMAVSKSQIAFKRRRTFAWAWIADRYLRGRHAPLVLSVAFHYRDPSPRWKEIVEPAPGRFMHHLELQSPDDLDQEVTQWLWEAWAEAA